MITLTALSLLVAACVRSPTAPDTTPLPEAEDTSSWFVALEPSTLEIPTGNLHHFSALLIDPEGRSVAGEVKWSATGGTIDQTGAYTAPAEAGTYRVTAVDTRSGAWSSAAIRVTRSVPDVALTDSGPIVVNRNGQVIENLRIRSDGSTPGIVVSGFSNVVIRNCEILHEGREGIRFQSASDILIERVAIDRAGAPASGPLGSSNQMNITGIGSARVRIDKVRVKNGSAGIYLLNCDGAHLSLIEGHNFRGPMPRGQLVQFDKCDDSILEDFSCENDPSVSYAEDNISIYRSSNCVIRRGLVVGNNSPSGVGVMFELSDGGASTGGLCEDVDVVGMGNGCFSAYPGYDITFRRTRARANICSDQGRGLPLSGGLAWAGNSASSGLRIEDSTYFDLCAGLVWKRSSFTLVELTEADFRPRDPIRILFPWE